MDPISVESEKEECSDYKKKKERKKEKRKGNDLGSSETNCLLSSRVLRTRRVRHCTYGMFTVLITQ